jgi:hypothetical protein
MTPPLISFASALDYIHTLYAAAISLQQPETKLTGERTRRWYQHGKLSYLKRKLIAHIIKREVIFRLILVGNLIS